MRLTNVTKLLLGLAFGIVFVTVLPSETSAAYNYDLSKTSAENLQLALRAEGAKDCALIQTCTDAEMNQYLNVRASVFQQYQTLTAIGSSAYNQIQQSNPAAANAINQSAAQAGLSMLGAGSGGLGGGEEISCKGIVSCLAVTIYYIGPLLASKVAYVGAYFFSIVISLSLNSAAYALQFLSVGWETVRDVANMAFIFILIYISITIMLQADTTGTIKTLAIVIVVALLVNFSFFFSRVVIDTGNVLALQFYNAIRLETVDGKPALIGGDQNGVGAVKDLSASIMGGLKVQTLLNAASFNNAVKAAGNSSWGALGIFTVVYLAVAAILWILFFTFLQVGIKFLLRIVGLWFIIIASPLAFVAKTMKKTSPYFDQWLKMLIQFSLYPAVFLFMFLILTQFASTMLQPDGTGNIFGSLLGTKFETSTGDAQQLGIISNIANVMIRLGFLVALMYVGLKVADWVVKDASSLASGISGRITGGAIGLAGFAGRKTIGFAAQRAYQSTPMRNWAAKGGLLGRNLWRGAGAVGSGSFDLRAAPGARTVLNKLGSTDVGTPGGKGGFAAREAARTAAREKESKLLKPSEYEVSKAISGVVEKLAPEQKQRLMNAANHLAEVKEAQKNGEASSADVKEAKKEYNAALKDLDINKKIKEAKDAAGAGNAKAYATAITTKNWRNVWGAASGTPGWISRADKEAALKIRGSGTDVDQIKNILSNLGVKPEDGEKGPASPHNDNNPGGGGGGNNDNAPGGGHGGGGGGGGTTPAAPGGAPPATPTPTTNAVAGRGGNRQAGTGTHGIAVTASLSQEDRDLFRKAIKSMRTSNENTSHGLADIARRVSNSNENRPANDNVATKSPANDNVVQPRAANDNQAGNNISINKQAGEGGLDQQKAA